jgi:peptidoglycan/xylan/chitin deacetylase (PgdA/CDA1 family)
LYHTDYSTMPADEQRREINEGLEKLDRLFPKKLVRYFIAPFNRVGRLTRRICREFNLHVLADEGVHLESALPSLTFEENHWYRYHHHRFYPQSSFTYYPLSFDMLDAALERSVAIRGGGESDDAIANNAA